VRPDLRESERVRVIPLGFHWALPSAVPLVHTPRPPFREYAWSFVGTDWKNRKEKLAQLAQVGENKLVLVDDWSSTEKLGREENLAILLNTWCVPCPAGQNAETYRFYEALEAGAIPILVKEDGMDAYIQMLSRWFPLLIAQNWHHAAQIIYTMRAKPEVYEQYRDTLLLAWEKAKLEVASYIRTVYRV
jgi:thiol-disulfide isomerase/thioredoxin